MSRPCKSAKVLTECSQTKDEIQDRINTENRLKGKGDKISPPSYLTPNQKKIFKYIVDQLKESGILGNLDVYILTTCSIALDRIQEVERLINKKDEDISLRELLRIKEVYTKDFFRCCNELSLSPQSRAKLSNINLQAKQEREDPLLKILKNKGSGKSDTKLVMRDDSHR